jgi:hypothetical protein
MAIDNRKLDIKDILDKATTGWIAPPTKPVLIMESDVNTRKSELTKSAGGRILILKNYEFTSEKLSPTRENRIWTFPCMIISQSEVLLQGIFDQMREVFDRYTSAPWATGTLGTGTTYSYARLVKGSEDPRLPKYVMDVTVILCEYLSPVVIA